MPPYQRLIPALISMLSLNACTGSKLYEVMDEPRYASQRPEIAQYIGHSYWPASPNGLCVSAVGENWLLCKFYKGRFFLDGQDTVYLPDKTRLHVQFENGVSGFTFLMAETKISDVLKDHDVMYDPDAYPLFLDGLSRKEADARRKLPGVRIWSSISDVPASAWGEPIRREHRDLLGHHGNSFHSTDTWYYPGGALIEFYDRSVFAIQR